MPITQSRMLELLDAAHDYQQALQQVAEFVEQQQRHVEAGRITPEQAYQQIAIAVQPSFLLQEPVLSPTILILEAKHFKAFRKKNDSAKESMRRARAGLPRTPSKFSHSNNAPESIRAVHAQTQKRHESTATANRSAQARELSWAARSAAAREAAGQAEDLDESEDFIIDSVEPTTSPPAPAIDVSDDEIERFTAQAIAEAEYQERYGKK